MSIWKSPVFYFGILLLLVVFAALAAPFIVNWNAYKPDLQAYGHRLTGREVTIAGPVQVRLFPWPRLEAENVTIANASDFGQGDFLAADKVTVRLSLAGLFSGSLDVEAIELDGPQLVVIRDKAGDTNWRMKPDEALAKSGLLNRVKLDQILIHRGSVWIEDEARNYSGGIGKLEAKLSAAAIDGPWKLIGSGEFRGEMVDLTVGTGSYEADKPLKISARAVPQDSAIPAVTMEGDWSGSDYKGKIRIDPHGEADQKQSAEGRFRPLKLEAEMLANIDRATFDKIKITPADTKDSGTLIEGNAKLDLVTPAHMQLVLKSPRVNLDTLLGAGSISQWRDGGILAIANAIFVSMPDNLTTDVDFNVAVLTAGGETLNNASVKGVVERQDIGITEAVVDLPGRSAARFDGIIFPGEGAAELKGNLAFESGDFRAFMGWLAPERKAGLDSNWKGSRGHLVLKSDVDWTPSRFAMPKLQYEFDGSPGDGNLMMRLGEVPGLNLKLKSARVDLDDLLPQGFSLVSSGKAMALSDVVGPFLARSEAGEQHLQLQTDSLLLNGVTAKDVSIDVASGLGGLEIKSIHVDDVDGAQLSGDGLILSTADGPSGNLKFNLSADDPSGFLRLAGLVKQASPSAWASVLGKTAIKLDIAADHNQHGPSLHVIAKGTSGPLSIDASGDVTDLAKVENATLALNGTVDTPDASNLVLLTGLQVLQGDSAAGRAKINMKGDLLSGFDTEISATGLDGTAVYKGRLQPGAAYWAPDGLLSLSAKSVGALRQVLGLPFAESATDGIAVSGRLKLDGASLKLSALQGQVLGQVVSGEATFDATGKLSADLTSGPIQLRDLLAVSFLAWDASTTDVAKSFVDPKSLPFPMEIFVHPATLETGVTAPLTETIIGYGASADALTLSLRQPGPDEQQMEVTLKPLGASFDVSMHGHVQFDVSKLLSLADGTSYASGMVQLDGKARGEGRSPAAVLASLGGLGSYWLNNVVLSQVTTQGFASAIQAVSTQDALTTALANLEKQPGTAVGERTGAFKIENGSMTLAPFGPADSDSDVKVDATADLTEGSLQLATQVGIRAKPDLPPVTITYLGKPGAMQKRSGTAALAAKLGYQLLAKEMNELEVLQQQQAALAAQEEQQRKDDEKRFAAYQETREELRKRGRERRIFAGEKAARAVIMQSGLANALQIGDALNKQDLAARNRNRAARRLFAITP